MQKKKVQYIMGNLFNGGKAFLRKMEKYKTISK